MKKKDLSTIKNKNSEELATMASEIRRQINRAKMEISLHKTKNTNIAKNLKKTLAQILTSEKEIKLQQDKI